MIRKAVLEDMDQIMVIIKKVVVIMQDSGNDQWSESYPSYDDFHADIIAGDLFVDSDSDGTIKAVICLNRDEPEEYGGIPWKYERPALVIHRMAVAPEYHGNGLAKKLITYAEERALELNLDYIRSDTCSRNNGMNALFKKLGYEFPGTLRFPGCKFDFNCYEKYIGKEEILPGTDMTKRMKSFMLLKGR